MARAEPPRIESNATLYAFGAPAKAREAPPSSFHVVYGHGVRLARPLRVLAGEASTLAWRPPYQLRSVGHLG